MIGAGKERNHGLASIGCTQKTIDLRTYNYQLRAQLAEGAIASFMVDRFSAVLNIS